MEDSSLIYFSYIELPDRLILSFWHVKSTSLSTMPVHQLCTQGFFLFFFFFFCC
ncbi:hypothetical protein Hanom_Chr09g00807271 [Helianthus anomalus]